MSRFLTDTKKGHPGLCGTLVGHSKDTHGTPVHLRRKAVGGPKYPPRDDKRQQDKDRP